MSRMSREKKIRRSIGSIRIIRSIGSKIRIRSR